MKRSVLINVDDIGIYPEAVERALETITSGLAVSGSVMSVTDGTDHALEVLGDRPDVPVGVHLTLTRDLPQWRWAPLTSGSSIQRDGLLAPVEHRGCLLARVRLVDVRREFRAQVEKVLQSGVQPTHLDWHCLADGGRPDIFDATLALAEEYGLTVRAWSDHGRAAVRATGRPVADQPFLDSFTLPVEGKAARLVELLRRLPVGLSEWAVHPAGARRDDPGSAVRVSDHRALLSPALREAALAAGVLVVKYAHGEDRRASSTGAGLSTGRRRPTTGPG